MKETMDLVIITPSGTFLDRSGVTYLEVKGTEGMLGIMPGHSPFVTTLLPAAIVFKTKLHRYDLAMSEGILYVDYRRATILADAAFFKNQIDYLQTRELLNNAIRRLKDSKEKEESKRLAREIETQEAKLKLQELDGRVRLK